MTSGTEAMIPKRGALAAWVELYAPISEAPPEAHLGAVLALASAALGWKAWIRWGENSEPCTVSVLLEGRSATARKTTVAAGAHTLANAAMAGIDADDALLKVRTLTHASDRGLIEQIGTTSEKTAAQWEQQPPPGTLLVWDEFGAVLGRPGDTKGADWLGRVRTVLMQMLGGRHGGIQTGQEKIRPSRCAVSILATMTRVELEQRASLGLLRDGFLGRFAVVPHNGRAAWLAEPPTWTPGMIQQRDSLVTWLRNLAQSREIIGQVFDRFDAGAHFKRQYWYEQRGEQLERDALNGGGEAALAASEAFGRLQTTALKIAAVAAVAEWSPPASLAGIVIEQRHIDYGIAFAEHALAEITDIAAGTDGVTADRYAQKVLAYLRERGPTGKKQLLDTVRIETLSRGQRWKIVEQLHPEDVEVRIVRTGGRDRTEVSLAD